MMSDSIVLLNRCSNKTRDKEHHHQKVVVGVEANIDDNPMIMIMSNIMTNIEKQWRPSRSEKSSDVDNKQEYNRQVGYVRVFK